jgi:hypothetical protein
MLHHGYERNLLEIGDSISLQLLLFNHFLPNMLHLMIVFGAKFAQLGVVHIDVETIFCSYVCSFGKISTTIVRNATFTYVGDLLIDADWFLL